MARRFKKRGRRILGIGAQSAIKGFFGGNAFLAIAILLLICIFLITEAYQFFPQHHASLKLYRKSGLEFVEFMKREVEGHTKLESLVAQAYYAELEEIAGQERSLVDAFAAIEQVARDRGEVEIEALYEAGEALERAKDDGDPAILAEAAQAEAEARAAWLEKLAAITAGLKREEVDSYGRLADRDWKQLLESLAEWDAVNEEPPPLVVRAQEDVKSKMADFEEAKDDFAAAIGPLRQLKERMREAAMEVKKEAVADLTAAARKAALLEGAKSTVNPEGKQRLRDEAAQIILRKEFPFAERTKPLRPLPTTTSN